MKTLERGREREVRQTRRRLVASWRLRAAELERQAADLRAAADAIEASEGRR